MKPMKTDEVVLEDPMVADTRSVPNAAFTGRLDMTNTSK